MMKSQFSLFLIATLLISICMISLRCSEKLVLSGSELVGLDVLDTKDSFVYSAKLEGQYDRATLEIPYNVVLTNLVISEIRSSYNSTSDLKKGSKIVIKDNTFTITITAQNGTKTTYTIYIKLL